ncbi:hypothetical protein [Streptococcus ferus]|uniref:hypothetical protein n=1 Tax=Streptococcus ferus TaxID=1345 RepID=UPI0035A0EECF
MNQLKEMIQTKLAEDLQKIDIYEIEDHDIILDEKPDLFFSDARTIYRDGDNYHVVALERGVIRFDKVYDSLYELMYYLLRSYVVDKASDIAWEAVNEDYRQYDKYAKMFDEEKIRLFTLIDPEYGKWKAKEIEEMKGAE